MIQLLLGRYFKMILLGSAPQGLFLLFPQLLVVEDVDDEENYKFGAVQR